MPGASVYLSGYVYSTTCGVEPMPISRFTRVRRTRPLTAYYDPLGVLQGYQDPAILGNGDALVLADEPLFDAVRLDGAFTDSGETTITFAFVNTRDRRELQIPLTLTNNMGGLFMPPIVLAPFCFNEIRVEWHDSGSPAV